MQFSELIHLIVWILPYLKFYNVLLSRIRNLFVVCTHSISKIVVWEDNVNEYAILNSCHFV
jgi:hypothetical protein